MIDKLDAIIFGATGFTGQLVVEDAVEMLKDFKWGIAGRNKKKLEHLLNDIGHRVEKDLSHIPIILADIEHVRSIENMVQNCKIIINCCGPYRFYGETVVKACIAAGTHHVDVSGEQQYVDRMQLQYHDMAKEKNVYIVSTCGFESIPAEMGVVYTERNFEGTINSMEMYWENFIDYKDKSSKTLLHYGTWESAVYVMTHLLEVWRLERKINRKIVLPTLTPKLGTKLCIQKPPSLDSYFLPLMAIDRAVVNRSQRLRYQLENKRPIQFETYMGFKSLCWTIFMIFAGIALVMLSFFRCSRRLLLRFPHIFSLGRVSHRGPTTANMNALNFRMTFKAHGWFRDQSLTDEPRKTVTTRVSGINPFYGFTSVAVISAAKIILKENDKMPESGGVLPPGAAFAKTSLIDELTKHKYGLKFETLN